MIRARVARLGGLQLSTTPISVRNQVGSTGLTVMRHRRENLLVRKVVDFLILFSLKKEKAKRGKQGGLECLSADLPFASLKALTL